MQSANYDSPTTIQGNSSGEAVPVTLAGTTGASATQVQGTAADGAAAVGNPVLVGGFDGTLVQSIAVNASGIVAVAARRSPADGLSNSNVEGTHIDQAGNAAGSLAGRVYNPVAGTWDRGRSGGAASGAFTPAAASHTAGDVNGAAATFAIGGPASGTFEIQSATLLIAGGTAETTAWTLHLYNVTPPSALADDSVWDIPSGDRASYQGSISLAQTADVGSSLYIETNNIGKRVALGATGSLFGYLVNGTTLTPQAVTHTVTILGRFI